MAERRPRSLFEKFAFVERKLAERGVPIKPGSRLQRERSFLTAADGSPRTVEPNDPHFREALEALRDFTLFERILESPLCARADRDVDAKLREALRDHVDPYSAARSVGRDTELELFVAAELARGGVPVCLVRADPTQRTPDVRARLDGQFFYVEVKRPKSRSSLLACIEDAVDQVQQTGCPGAVFVETSLAFNPEGGLVTRPMPDAEFRTLYGRGLRLNIQPFEADLLRLLATGCVGGIAFQDHQKRDHPTDGWELASTCMMFNNPAATARVAAAWKAFQRTLPHER